MKQYITKTETKTIKIFDSAVCDICGAKISNGSYAVDQVSIKHEVGDAYPEDINIETFSPDICGGCFSKHIIPVLKGLGVNIEYMD